MSGNVTSRLYRQQSEPYMKTFDSHLLGKGIEHSSGICHVFNVHSHITYLVSLAVIAEKQLDPSDCVFLQTRDYSIPDNHLNFKVYDLIFPLSDLSVYYNENTPELCQQNMDTLRSFVSKMTEDRPFHLYLPCTHMFHAIILLSYDDCIAYSLIEEGLQVYLSSAESQVYQFFTKKTLSDDILEKCNSQRLRYLGVQRPFCLFRHEKFDHAYCVDSKAFPFISKKIVLENPFREDVYPDCENTDAILVLGNEQAVANLDMKPFLESLKILVEYDFKIRGFKKVLYRTKEVANKTANLNAIHRFFHSYQEPKFVHMDSNSVVENIINKYKLPVYSTICSVTHYATLVGAVSRSFAPLYEELDSNVQRITSWAEYKTTLANYCEMYDKKTLNCEYPTVFRKAPDNNYKGVVHVCIACDDTYLPHACALIASIVEASKRGITYHFHIIQDGNYKTESIKKFQKFHHKYKFNYNFYTITNKLINDFKLNINYISKATYYRFFIASLLPQSIDKILYLDCDMIATTCLSELYGIDLGDHYAGVVFQQQKRWCVMHPTPYFNAGLLLLNLKKMRSDDIENKFFEFERVNKKQLEAQDQCVLNGVFKGNVLWLPLKWNMMIVLDTYYDRFIKNGALNYFSDVELNDFRKNPGIIHYYCDKKPWNTYSEYAHLYWKWAAKTPFYDPHLHGKIMEINVDAFKTTSSPIQKISASLLKKASNSMKSIISFSFRLSFKFVKKTVKSVLRPFKPYVQKIVNVACTHQIQLLERSLLEQRKCLQKIDRIQKSNDSLIKSIAGIKLQIEKLAKTNHDDILGAINSVRDEQLQMHQSVGDSLAKYDYDVTEELKKLEQRQSVALADKFEELKKEVLDRKEQEFASRLIETEKRFELEKKSLIEKTTVEIRNAKDKEFAEKLEIETKSYFKTQIKKVFPSMTNNMWSPYVKRQEKPFTLIVGCSFSGTSIMQTVLQQHPDIYSFRTNAITGLDEPVGESCLFDPRRNNCLSDNDIVVKLEEVVVKATGYRTVLEKTPDNLFHLGRINLFLTNTKYICMVRDGRDVIASFLNLDGPTTKNCLYRIKYWLACIDHMEKYISIANNMKMVRLEDFTIDPHTTIHSILEFANLNHSPEIVDYMLRYHERIPNAIHIPKERIMTGSIKEGDRVSRIFSVRDIQTKQPVYKDTSHWRQDIPVELWPFVYEKIGSTLERLGYVDNAEQSLNEELEKHSACNANSIVNNL